MKISKKIKRYISNYINSVAQVSFGVTDERDVDEKIRDLSRKMAAEGVVLLKNENDALPLSENDVISVFGRTQRDYFYVGYGSGGDVKPPYKISPIEGLLKCDKIKINAELAEIYEDWCLKNPVDDGFWGHWPLCYEEMPISKDLAEKMSKISSTAVIIIGRAAGEDREMILKEGSYYLTETEREMISNVSSCFEKTIVLLNCGSIIDMSWVKLFEENISAICYVWQGGMESGNAIADILSGKISPSGKLTDTIALSYQYYPTAKNFGGKVKNVYAEDIFVDYRYFETFDKNAVLYPFGFGLSYADFEIEYIKHKCHSSQYSIECNVCNKSMQFAGKEVVQIYVEPPQGKLSKEKRRLIAFKKTDYLQPNESVNLILSFDEYALSSFDDNGNSGFENCYVLEKGEYKFFIGSDVRSAKYCFSVMINGTKVIAKHLPICKIEEPFERMIAVEENGTLKARTLPAKVSDYSLKERILQNIPPYIKQNFDTNIKLKDVKDGKFSLDEFVSQLSFCELEAISRGDYVMNSPLGAKGNAGALGGVSESLRQKGVPPAITTDGPSGIRLQSNCSLLPNGACLASSMDPKLISKLYHELGKEMKDRGSDILLAPGMNIHRNPLCGRNFEYFSADPLVSGEIAAAVVTGLQSANVSACPKHFACNNQETNRTNNNSIVSQRALREIYLKGFEIVVKKANPDYIMTSYNKINGVWSHYNFDLCKTVLRDEWKFGGCIMTDWWMKDSESPEFPGVKIQGYRIRSGVNVLMPGDKRIPKMKPDGTANSSMSTQNGLTIGEMQENAKYILSSGAVIRKV